MTFTNLLPIDDASFEGGLGTWAVVQGTVGRSNAYALDGSYSMTMSTYLSGARCNAVPVTAGTTYTAVASFRASTAAASMSIQVNWLDSSGTLISASSAQGNDTTTGFTQLHVTAPAPANAVSAQLQLTNRDINNTTHYVDEVGISAGTDTTWAPGQPPMPSWTSPADGTRLAIGVTTFTFSVSGSIDSSEWRRVADDGAGHPDPNTVYASGTGTAAQRSFDLDFETARTEHVQVRVIVSGVSSDWADSTHSIVSLTPLVSCTAGAAEIVVDVANDYASSPVASNDIFRRLVADGGNGVRVATGVAPDGSWTDYTPGSGVAYQYLARVHFDDGSTADSAWSPA